MKKVLFLTIFLTVSFGFDRIIRADELSIYDIQFSTDPNGDSPYHGSIVDCKGGIVIHIKPGQRTKLTLYDPNFPDAWGGIMAKDCFGVGVLGDVNVGDWVSFHNFEVEDFKGTTFLQYIAANNPSYTVESEENPLPKPLAVAVDEIAAPIEGIDEWVVADHNCEKYEAMLIKVVDVNVKDLGYGKAYDNYVLASNVNPANTCWASDYMNKDATEIYHPLVQIDQRFCGVAGILEQYEAEKDGIYYDYYQLLTTCTGDFTINQQADFDDDCDVDFVDYDDFAFNWLRTGCTGPGWCGGADLTEDGSVDANDLRLFTKNWMEGKL